MRYVGIKPVVVHGGGKAITDLMKRLGLRSTFVGGNRVTTREAVEVAEMVLVGRVNKEIVSLLNRYGGRAVGLSGKDGGLIQASQVPDSALGLVGEVDGVDTAIIEILDREGFIPVVAPVAESATGQTLNINADAVAAALAGALKAEKLIFLTDVDGICRIPDRPDTLISTLHLSELQALVKDGTLRGGMLAKIQGCERALREQVLKVHIISGLRPHSLLLELFTDRGVGTQVLA
jgi:acetylglutamate kinase